jgi:hypothetical protein
MSFFTLTVANKVTFTERHRKTGFAGLLVSPPAGVVPRHAVRAAWGCV